MGGAAHQPPVARPARWRSLWDVLASSILRPAPPPLDALRAAMAMAPIDTVSRLALRQPISRMLYGFPALSAVCA